MVEGPGTAFLFRMVRPQNCMKTNLFLEIRVHFAFAGPFFSRKSVPQTKKGPSLAALYRCITTSCHFQGQKMDFFWVSMDGARKIFKQNPAFEEAPRRHENRMLPLVERDGSLASARH